MESPNADEMRQLTIRNLRDAISELPQNREHLFFLQRWLANREGDTKLIEMIDELDSELKEAE